MFNIKYETWEKVVNTYFDIPGDKLTSYLQWFPFTKFITRQTLLSKEYFENNIKKGFFLVNSDTMLIQRNYMQKTNGQYRQSQLISPIIFLIIQSICVQISESIILDRQEEVLVYYSGNISNLNPLYQDEYSKFTKTLILEKDSHDYFIKLDISNYFPSINIDKLFSLIESKSPGMDQIDLLMYRELIMFIGNGKFPVIQNSMGTSYLATSIYLAEIDNEIFKYFSNTSIISSFKMFRYVDDLYILFNSDADQLNLNKFHEEFQQYSNTLFHLNELDLNFEKAHFAETSRISEVLSTPFYNEIVNGEEFDIYEIETEQQESLLIEFLNVINQEISINYNLTNQKFMEIVDSVFVLEDSDLSSKEILNRVIYSKQLNFQNIKIKNSIIEAADYHVVRVAPKVFLTLLLNTEDGDGIRNILKNLLYKSRDSEWIINDLDLAIIYLLKRNFQHKDLINALIGQSRENEILNEFINCYCLQPCWQSVVNEENEILINLKITKLTNQIYFLFLVNKKRDDYLAAYSYYKSYFDRISAELAWARSGFEGKPNYKLFHQKKNLLRFYEGIEGGKEIIMEASRYRNFNPINHGSAELISQTRISRGNLIESLSNLNGLIMKKIEELKSNY